MITCKLYGQLGNQIFQISAAVCHAWKMNTDYAIPAQSISPRVWSTYIHHLPIAKKNLTTRNYYKETCHSYKPLPAESNLTIDGYFQSEKYWNAEKERLAELLQFELNIKSFIAVHVRRGDYLKYPDQFPVLPVFYYLDAIDKMKSLGYSNYRIFSDDIKWCEKVFAGFKKVNIEYQPTGQPLADMKTMYCASAFIIANSTYSLFPALLRNDNPLVIAPAEHRWFGPRNAHIVTNDKMNKQWVKI